MIKRYFYNIFVAVDQLINTLLYGDPDETISSRIGKAIYQRHSTNPILIKIDQFLNWIQPDHCKYAVENDEGKDELKRWD